MVCSKSLVILWALLHSTLANYITCEVDWWATCSNVNNNMIASGNTTRFSRLAIKKTNLAMIPQKFIDQFVRLDHLDISYNAFTELRFDHITDTLANLGYLSAGYNKITSLAEDVFKNTTNLKRLALIANQIQALPSKVFYGLSHLEYLDLSLNQIKTLDQTVFWPLLNLQYILLNNNRMTFLRLDMTNLINLKEFSAQENNLSDCSLVFSQEDVGNINVHLSRNMLELLDITGNVRSVNATNNLIRNVNIIPWSKIKDLDLTNNRINDISNITRMSSLKLLNLSGNELRSFDLNDLKSLTKLESLKLDSNDMTELVGFEDIKKILPKLKTIQLSKNRFNCSHLQILLKAVDATGVEVSVPESSLDMKHINVRGIKCIDHHTYENNKPLSNDKKEKASNEETDNKMQSICSALTRIENQLHELSSTVNSNKKELSILHLKTEEIGNVASYVTNQLLILNNNINLKDDRQYTRRNEYDHFGSSLYPRYPVPVQ